MTDAERVMREWLASDDPAKRRHAERRIAIGFDRVDAVRSGSFAEQSNAEHRTIIHGWRPSRFRAVQTCLYRDCHTGCRASICHARYGDSDGGGRTSLTNCYECLGLNRETDVASR